MAKSLVQYARKHPYRIVATLLVVGVVVYLVMNNNPKSKGEENYGSFERVYTDENLNRRGRQGITQLPVLPPQKRISFFRHKWKKSPGSDPLRSTGQDRLDLQSQAHKDDQSRFAVSTRLANSAFDKGGRNTLPSSFLDHRNDKSIGIDHEVVEMLEGAHNYMAQGLCSKARGNGNYMKYSSKVYKECGAEYVNLLSASYISV